jgi:hypothetical protein
MLRIPVSRVRPAILPRALLFLSPLLFLLPLLLPTAIAVGATPTTPPGKAARPAAKPVKPVAPPVCAPGETGVSMMTTESDIKCDEGFVNCNGELQIAARNCTGEFQLFVRLEIYEGTRRTLVLEFSPATIAPHNGIWRETIPWSTPGEVTAEVFYHPPAQNNENSARGPFKISNKALAAAHAACEQCQGTWGHFGVNKHEGCNCKTADGGKLCHDGEECQGYCVFQRYDGEAHEEGICSENKYLAGCYPIIFKGASQFPPSRPPPRKRTTCVD